MTKLAALKKQWMKDPDVREAYEAHAFEFEIARSLIEARSNAGLTQAEVAKRMGTTQSVIARIEGGSQLPSMKSVIRYARAIGAHPVLQLIQLR
ncbi:MAG: helix-turn-helix transcriptional regulator [Zetaproteobacteria bacterium]|nr:helix-turn-helix transcriptional regulator [Zetaproteobacteria bacterium]